MADESPEDNDRPRESSARGSLHPMIEAGSRLSDAIEAHAETISRLGEVGEATRRFDRVGAAVRQFDRVGEAARQISDMARRIELPPRPAIELPKIQTVDGEPLALRSIRDYELEAAYDTRDRVEDVARLLAEGQEEAALREAEQVAREVRALNLAEKSVELAARSHAEAQRQRVLTAWSVGIAVVALIVAVMAMFAG